MAENDEPVGGVGGEPTISDEEVLGFDPGAPPKFAQEKSKAASGDEGTPVSVETPSEAGTSAEKAADDQSLAAQPAAGSKFSFYGREFDSQAAAEAWFKTWEGQVGAADRRLREYAEQLAQANARIQELSAPREPEAPKEAPKPAEAPKKLADLIDWNVYRALADEKGVDVANEWYTLKLEEALEARLEARMKTLEEKTTQQFGDRLAGWEQLSGYMTKLNHAAELFEQLADRVNEDGSPTFPEMGDTAFIEEMAGHWDKIPGKESLGLRGAYLAYLEAKDWRGRRTPPAPPAATQARPPVADRTISGGGGNPRAAQPAGRSNSVRDALREEANRIDPVIGF